MKSLKNSLVVTVLLTCSFFVVWGQRFPMHCKIDYRTLVSNADLLYEKPTVRSEAGQPIGNGRMGTLVWTTPQSIRFQINRSDIFASNSETNNFDRHLDYCGGAGFVDIDFHSLEDLFAEGFFEQHLSCYDGVVTIKGKGVEVTSFVWSDQDVMVVKIRDSRERLTPVTVNLRSIRALRVERGDHSALSALTKVEDKAVLTQEFTEGNYLNRSAVVVYIPDSDSKSWFSNDSEIRISPTERKREFTILVSSAATFDADKDVIKQAIGLMENAESTGLEKVQDFHKTWWHTYWEKSFVQLFSEDGKANYIEKYYTYYLYVMGAASRGEYPAKFNGMLWNTGGDERDWGSLFWGANESCIYDALLASNRIDLMDPLFNMYFNMKKSGERTAQQIFGSEGIWIPETVGFDGLPEIPEDIVPIMRQLYLYNSPLISNSKEFRNFIDYASTKHPHHSLWNWKSDDVWIQGQRVIKDRGCGFVGNVLHTFSRGAKVAYLFWLKYEYTQNKAWLTEYAYPIIKGIAEFYRNYPHVKKGKDGKYHISHVNDNESVWGGTDTAEEISSIMSILPVAIRSAEIIGVDAQLCELWKDFYDNLAPLPLSSDYTELKDKPVTFVRSSKPALAGPATESPDSNTMPQWCLELVSLESDNTRQVKIAEQTYDTYFSEGINETTEIGNLSMLPVAGALLGKKEATEFLIANQIRMNGFEELANRMDLREGSQTNSVERLGRSAHALQNALCQSIPSKPGESTVIHVFPAWPDHWNARFHLYARGNFLVSSSFQKGQIEFIKIFSKSGEVCRIRNPWKENAVLYVNGKKKSVLSGSLIEFPTEKNNSYLLMKVSCQNAGKLETLHENGPFHERDSACKAS